MASVYLDNDVGIALAHVLIARGHHAYTARDEGQSAARDPAQLLYAAERDWVFITHNRKDFRLLHDAWQSWPPRWDCRIWRPHAGILVPEQLLVPDFAPAVLDLLDSGTDLRNRLHEWTRAHGWRERIR